MPMQSESKDSNPGNHQSARDGTSGSAGGTGTGSTAGTTGGSAASQGSQQSGQQSSQQNAMPPSETDDDQYDQGTVQKAP